MTQLKTDSLTAQFSYDPMGRRTGYTKGSTLKTYFYQGLSMLSDGASTFLDGAGLDEHLQADTPLGSQAYLNDHLGSTSRLLGSLNGSNKAAYDYTSYGKLEGGLSNPSASNPYTYTGREDDVTGLYYYRARYYDPELEVFISQDPLGDAQRYVGGNPMSYLDPLGLVDVLFSAEGAGHTGVLTEPMIAGNDSTRYVYGTSLQDNFTPNQTIQAFPLINYATNGNQVIVELDPAIFGNDKQFINSTTTKKPFYSLAPTPLTPMGNCSAYTASVLNEGLAKHGLAPLTQGWEPSALILELMSRGYVKTIYHYNSPLAK